MKIFQSRIAIALLFTSILVSAGKAGAYDRYGNITPSNVYSLWSNINNTLSLFAPNTSLSEALSMMESLEFTGKAPADVLGQINGFRDKLSLWRANYNLLGVQTYKDVDGNEITPSVVFVNSGHVLDSLMELLWHIKPLEESYREYYKQNIIDGMEPSDVFGLVELANRKISLLIAE